MTTPITAAATMRLIEAGRLRLGDPVEGWLPELAQQVVLRVPDAPLHDVTQPGEGFRYHHSFAILGILLSRVAGRPLAEHLAEDLFGPGMVDSEFWVEAERAHRLAAAYRHEDGALVETEPAGGGGIWVGRPPIDVSHNELVSTVADVHRFAAMLRDGGRLPDGTAWLTADSVAEMTRDQVAPAAKTAESFFPGFWDGMGRAYGVGVRTADPHAGRCGWSGGQGTDFFVDPATGTVAILLSQVELGPPTWGVIDAFQSAVGA